MDKTYFQHDMAYGKYKDLTKRMQSDKFLKDKALKIASNPKYDGYQRGLASSFLAKNPQVVVCQIKNLQMNFVNQLLESLKEKSLFFI